MNQSIYTEYSNLTPDHVAWLDGCGATKRSGNKVSQGYRDKYLLFLVDKKIFAFTEENWLGYELKTNKGIVHIPTGSEFCERVAEILEIDKPVFASDLKDKLVKKLELHDRMERPLPEGEDKELAIEVSQLREEDIEALVEMCGEAWAEVPKQALKNKNERYLFYREGGLDCHHKMGLKNLGVTITESVPEFMRYVAKKTGKKWEDKLFNDAFFNNDSSNIMSPDEVDAIIQSIASPPTYPHRLYRVLDSLDGIPFDTRMPLSEWIPPFGVDLIFISDADWYRGIVHAMDQRFIYLLVKGEEKECIVPLDGHWMRIV